jgi:hypothetical protein
MNKTRFSLLAAVSIIGITLPALPASASDNSGLNVAVYTYEGGGSPDRDKYQIAGWHSNPLGNRSFS